MKFLLWACLMYVSFARDYSDNIGSPYPLNPSASISYPVIPSASIPYPFNPSASISYPVTPSASIPCPVNPSASIPCPMPDRDFTPPVYLTKTNLPNDPAVPSNPLVFTALGAPLYSIAGLPISPFSGQLPPTGVFRLVPVSSRPIGPLYSPNEAAPSANTYIVEILVPPTTPPHTVPDVQPLTITEPDEAEPAADALAAPEPQSSISFDRE